MLAEARTPMTQDLAPDAVALIVEGTSVQQIVRALLEAARYPLNRVRIFSAKGKPNVAQAARDLAAIAPGQCAVLIDLDEQNVPDARARAREQLGEPPVEVFCAVPEAEAWLFADEAVVVANARSDKEVQRILRRLPLPEEIPQPKALARHVFGSNSQWSFLRQVDIGRAAARSPSLRSFFDGMAKLLGLPTAPLLEGAARSLSRDIIAGLIQEVSPKDAVVWRTAAGDEYTAAELQHHIEAGDEIGRQYSSDLLRISRDLLRRTANRARTE